MTWSSNVLKAGLLTTTDIIWFQIPNLMASVLIQLGCWLIQLIVNMFLLPTQSNAKNWDFNGEDNQMLSLPSYADCYYT